MSSVTKMSYQKTYTYIPIPETILHWPWISWVEAHIPNWEHLVGGGDGGLLERLICFQSLYLFSCMGINKSKCHRSMCVILTRESTGDCSSFHLRLHEDRYNQRLFDLDDPYMNRGSTMHAHTVLVSILIILTWIEDSAPEIVSFS